MSRRPRPTVLRRHVSFLRRTAAFTAVLLSAWLAVSPAAGASVFAEASARSSVVSASFGAVVTPTAVTSVPSCPSSEYCTSYTFTLTSGPGATPAFFDVWNSGSVSLVGLSYRATWGGPGSIDVTACSVAWTTGPGGPGGPGPGHGGQATCSGTHTAVMTNETSGTYDPATLSGTFPPARGVEIYLEAQAGAPAPPPNAVVTVSLSVCSGGAGCSDGTTSRQIRAATTTNA